MPKLSSLSLVGIARDRPAEYQGRLSDCWRIGSGRRASCGAADWFTQRSEKCSALADPFYIRPSMALYSEGLRKLLAIAALLLGCLFVAQSTMAASAVYSDCCTQGCEGMAACASVSCQVCAVLTAAPPPCGQSVVFAVWRERFGAGELLPSAPFAEIWTPPD